MSGALTGLDVAVLAGGLGTRLRSVLGDETPKVLAPIHGRPFLNILADWLGGYGAARLVLCLGHLADKVVDHAAGITTGPKLVPMIEPHPMGTGGALRFAAGSLTSDPILVMNGDSWVDADLSAFVADHRAHDAYLTILCVPVSDASRFGRVELDANGAIAAFCEKEPTARSGLINAGLYLLSAAAMADLAKQTGPSLERDFFQTRPAGQVRAFVCMDAKFIDFGTPESFAEADHVIRSL